MKFYVINKPNGVTSVEATTLKDAIKQATTNPFMVVAARSVEKGDAYQAIQIKENTVLINYKGKNHEYVEAGTLAAAFGEMPVDDQTIENVTITYQTDHGETPDSMSVDKGTLLKDVVPTLDDVTSLDKEYIFKGWKTLEGNLIGKKTKVETDITLVAQWEEKDIEPVDNTEPITE